MAGASTKSNAPKPRKRVEAETSTATLKRARDGSAFARWYQSSLPFFLYFNPCSFLAAVECKSSVPVALIDMHSCSLEAKIKMNLEAQVVEREAEVKKKPAEAKKNTGAKKKAAASESETESKPKKKLKKASDSNKPKRPPTAFFLFMADFRVTYKEENPDNKKVSEVAKQGGEKWKSMSDEEKKPYIEKAAELKADFGKAVESNTTENENDDETHQPEELCDEETHQPEELCDEETHQPEELTYIQ
ncbi:hypothetical protein V2J09_005907 [Rumex salicifolius]